MRRVKTSKLIIIGNKVYAAGPRGIYKPVRSVRDTINNIIIEMERLQNGQYVSKLD